ncbi:MAG TPA: acyl carrier protein [Terriglobia bacterium]|nr:acyl carrier protein [Terriglobia bacterium]
MTTEENLNQVFRTVFDDTTIQIRPDMTANDIEGWDSLSHVNLILAVESAFGITFGQKEILSFRNIGHMMRSIEDKVRG